MDCCHSASGTRDPNTGIIRGIELSPAYTEHASLTKKDFHCEDGSNTSRASSSTPHNHVLLAACREDQHAGEAGYLINEQYTRRGHFTRKLVQVLAAAEQRWQQMTYVELITCVGRSLYTLVGISS
jgi:hypothetical protein